MKSKVIFFNGCIVLLMASLITTSVNSQTKLSNNKLSIDGILNDNELRNTVEYTEFFQNSPNVGIPVQEQNTKVWFKSDETGIYIAFENRQTASEHRTGQHRRDAGSDYDQNFFVIDPSAAGTTGYVFVLTHGGSKRDFSVDSNNQRNQNWNAEWKGVTTTNAESWVSEFFIPWDQIGTQGTSAQAAIYFGRKLGSKSQLIGTSTTWLNRPNFLTVLQGVDLVKGKGQSLQIFPYASITYENDATVTPSVADEDLQTGVNIDYNSGTGSVFSASLRPDFGQVESDDLIVNFGSVETFFRENRKAFAQYSEYFNVSNFGAHLFYSRRIGASIDLDCDFWRHKNNITDAAAIQQCNADADTSRASTLDVGLNYIFSNQKLSIATHISKEADTNRNKGKNYFITRGNFTSSKGKSGFILLRSVRPALSERTTTALGYDFNYTFGKWNLKGFFAQAERDYTVLPTYDAEYSTKKDNAIFFEALFQPTENSEVQLWHTNWGKDFQINDIGFLEVNDRVRYGLEYKVGKPNLGKLKSFRTGGGAGQGSTTDGQKLGTWLFNWVWMQFQNTSSLNISTNLIDTDISTTLLADSDSPAIAELGDHWNLYLRYESKKTGNFQWRCWGELGNFASEIGNKYKRVDCRFSYKINAYEISLSQSFRERDKWSLYQSDLNSDNNRADLVSVFKSKDTSMNLTFNWIPSEKHELSARLQLVEVKAVDPLIYSVNNAGKSQFENQIASEDFKFSQLSFQLRYKYKLAPLSWLYVVWGRGGSEDTRDNDIINANSVLDSYRELLATDSVDSITIKVEYRFKPI